MESLMLKKSTLNYRRTHKSLLWFGGISLLLFVMSGITHPLLTWFVLAIVLRLDPFWVKAGVLYAALPIAATASGISHSTYWGEYTLLVSTNAAMSRKST